MSKISKSSSELNGDGGARERPVPITTSAGLAPPAARPLDLTDEMTGQQMLDVIDTRRSEPPDPVLERLRPTGILLIGTSYTDIDLHRAMSALPDALRGADPTLRELVIRRAAATLKAAGVDQPMQLIRGVVGNGGNPSKESGQGEAITLTAPEAWPEPVDGAELLADIVKALTTYIALPPGAATAIALWIILAHAHDAATISPNLAVISPEKGCGKSTLLDALYGLVPKALMSSNISSAVLFRAVEKFSPTLLVDELDSYLNEREELRGLLNSGHTRAGAVVLRAVGDDFEPRAFSTWCPKALALIGRLPSTLEDRSIVIPMRRRRSDEQVTHLRLDRRDHLRVLQRQAARWAQDHHEELLAADPVMPAGLSDRATDNWRMLVAIADTAGGVWPERARKAAALLTGAVEEGEQAPGIQLLADVRALAAERAVDRLTSEELVEALVRREDRPWPEFKGGRPITVRQVATLLTPYGIRPRTIRVEDRTPRGYRLSDFADAFARYLPSDPQHPQQSRSDATSGPSTIRNTTSGVADHESPETPRGDSLVADVADGKGGWGPKEELAAVIRELDLVPADGGTAWFPFAGSSEEAA